MPPPAYGSAELAQDVDLLLKANEIDKALDVVDRHVLIDGSACRRAWSQVAERHGSRSATAGPSADLGDNRGG